MIVQIKDTSLSIVGTKKDVNGNTGFSIKPKNGKGFFLQIDHHLENAYKLYKYLDGSLNYKLEIKQISNDILKWILLYGTKRQKSFVYHVLNDEQVHRANKTMIKRIYNYYNENNIDGARELHLASKHIDDICEKAYKNDYLKYVLCQYFYLCESTIALYKLYDVAGIDRDSLPNFNALVFIDSANAFSHNKYKTTK